MRVLHRSTLSLVALFSAVCIGTTQAQKGYVTTPDGVRLFYRMVGTGRDTVVVLHGGAGMTMEYLLPDLQPLESRHVLLYYDQRGSGRSTIVKDTARLRAADHTADLNAIRRHFNLERLTILGHSWGGMLAALYGFTYPEHVKRLLLVEAGPPRLEPYSRMFDAAIAARMDSSSGVRVSRLEQAADTASDQISICRQIFGVLASGYWADVANQSKAKGKPCTTKDWLRNFGRVNNAMLASVGAYDWRARLSGVTVPVLIIHGTRDPIPLDAAREWAAGFPDARLLTIQKSGHFPWIEQPETFFPAVETFLDGSWPTAAHAVHGN